MAPSAARLAPKSLRQLIWPTVFCLASTRTLILAHYPSDVAAGLAIGLATNKSVEAALRRWRIWLAAGRAQKLKNVVEPRMRSIKGRFAKPRELTAGNARTRSPVASKKALGRGLHYESLLVELKAKESRQVLASESLCTFPWGA
jgi:hypothetical protein